MADQRAIDYIKEHLDKGISEYQVRSELVRAGWPQQEINAAFDALHADGMPPPPPAPVKKQSSHMKLYIGVIVIIIAVPLVFVFSSAILFSIGLLQGMQDFTSGPRCSGFANIGCPTNWQLDTDGDFMLEINNQVGSEITITQVDIIIGSYSTTDYSTRLIRAGRSFTYNPVGSGGEFYYMADSGTYYSAHVEIIYTVDGSTLEYKELGTLSSNVV